MSTVNVDESVGSIHDGFNSQSGDVPTSPIKKRRVQSTPPDFDSLPYDVQEEIECLYEFVPEVSDHFVVLNKIGEGTFSSVFMAKLKKYPDLDQLFALKHIIPTSHPSRIEGELRCLQEIGGCDNVMGVELCIRHKDHVVIIMPYFPHETFQEYILSLSVCEVREYMRNLLVALRRVHMFNMIHRDVKPSNFLYNRKTKQYALVDFGLAHKVPEKRESKLAKRIAESKAKSDRKPLSTSKQHQDVINQKNISANTSPSLAKDSSTELKKCRNFTPPTPDLASKTYTKKIRSPRSVLLAKRALMAKERENKQSKAGSSLLQMNPGLSTCQCFGLPQVCSICTARSNQHAPRAGTPGFRSPEVLMKCPDQTTAVDIWSAGVIFLSLLSGRYPFFRAHDDMTALAQIISIMGSEKVSESAKVYGKNMICSPTTPALDLKTLCTKLRSGPVAKSRSKKGDSMTEAEHAAMLSWAKVPDSAYDLLSKLLDLNPFSRVSAEDALQHEFFTESS